MTTLVNFQPNTLSPFQFQATLDDVVYTIIITWNVYGQRYYLNVLTLAGVLVLAEPLIGSPGDQDINLVKGYFTSTLVYREPNKQFEIN